MIAPTSKLALALPPAPRPHVSLLLTWPKGVLAVAVREDEPLVIGRGRPADVVVDDHSVSRLHARFSLSEGRVEVEDLASTNGTYLNDLPIERAYFGEGDVVRLGAVEARVSGTLHADDGRQQIVPQATWMRRLEEETRRARLFGRGLALLAVRHGAPVRERPRISPTRVVDFACAYTPYLTLVMLPELDLAAVIAFAATLHVDNDPRAFGIALYPTHGSTSEELISVLLAAAHAAVPNGPPLICRLSGRGSH